MSLPYAQPKFAEGAYVQARPSGPPIFDVPVPATTARYVFRQKFQQFLNNKTALALNTAHPDYATYYLVSESTETSIGGGVVEWERTYAQVPESYNEWETFAYNFIGYIGTYGGILQTSALIPTGRNRQTVAVQSRIQNDFFLTGQEPYSTPGDIPAINAQKYRLIPTAVSNIWWMDTDWICTNPPYNFSTTPSRATYEGYIVNANQFGWASGNVVYKWGIDGSRNPVVDTTGSGANPGQICAEDSRLDRWMGNIYLRRTRFVLAA